MLSAENVESVIPWHVNGQWEIVKGCEDRSVHFGRLLWVSSSVNEWNTLLVSPEWVAVDLWGESVCEA